MVSCIVSDRSVSETWNEVISFVYFAIFGLSDEIVLNYGFWQCEFQIEYGKRKKLFDFVLKGEILMGKLGKFWFVIIEGKNIEKGMAFAELFCRWMGTQSVQKFPYSVALCNFFMIVTVCD